MRYAATGTAAALAIVISAYVAWPYWSAAQLRNSFEANDAVAISRRVDWPSLRDSIRGLLSAEMNRAVCASGMRSGGQIVIVDDVAYAVNTATRRLAETRNLRIDVGGRTLLVKRREQSVSWPSLAKVAASMGCTG